MKTSLVRIAGAQGVVIPQDLLDQAGLISEVELTATQGGLLVTPLEGVRVGWAAAARSLREVGEDLPVDHMSTDFDTQSWEW